jgi:hypothetical protein
VALVGRRSFGELIRIPAATRLEAAQLAPVIAVLFFVADKVRTRALLRLRAGAPALVRELALHDPAQLLGRRTLLE